MAQCTEHYGADACRLVRQSGRRRAISRLGARTRRQSTWLLVDPDGREATRPFRSSANRTVTFRRNVARRRARRSLFLSTRRRPKTVSRSGVAFSTARRAWAVAGGRSSAASQWTRRRLAGRDAARARSSTSCTSARLRRKGTWAGGRGEAAAPARPWHHADRGDAGRRVSGQVRLGLRRRLLVRADANSTARPTTFARLSTRHIGWASA